MSGIRPSPAQQAHRARLQAADRYAKSVLADPGRAAGYQAEAARRGLTLRALAIRDFFHSPRIESVAVHRAGARLYLQAQVEDAFEVAALSVTLATAERAREEEGSFALEAGEWTFDPVLPWPARTAVIVTLQSTDRPGNRTNFETTRTLPG